MIFLIFFNYDIGVIFFYWQLFWLNPGMKLNCAVVQRGARLTSVALLHLSMELSTVMLLMIIFNRKKLVDITGLFHNNKKHWKTSQKSIGQVYNKVKLQNIIMAKQFWQIFTFWIFAQIIYRIFGAKIQSHEFMTHINLFAKIGKKAHWM